MTDLDARMRALRSRTRREILARIWDRDLAAGEIAGTFALTPATISEHLGVLRRAGLVEMTKVGTSRRYRANPTALAGLHGALEDAGKWRPADDLPEQALTTTSTAPVVVAEVAVTIPPETDLHRLDRRRAVLALAAGSGHHRRGPVRGHAGVGHRGPRALRVRGPAPADRDELGLRRRQRAGAWPPLAGYLRVYPEGEGSRVVVHQVVNTADQAAFMAGAWAMVLGRLKANVVAALDGTPPAPRVRRRKETGPRPQE